MPHVRSSRGFFMCRIDLTDEGQAHAAEAAGVVFRRAPACPPAARLCVVWCVVWGRGGRWGCSGQPQSNNGGNPPPSRYLDLLRAPGGINEATWQEMRQLAEIKVRGGKGGVPACAQRK